MGESAGQVKPTTAGGIMTSVAGAVMAAHWVSESLRLDDPDLLGNYPTRLEGSVPARNEDHVEASEHLREILEP